MKHLHFVVLALTLAIVAAEPSVQLQLTIINDPDNNSNLNKILQIYPSSFSSPTNNFNDKVFSIFAAQPSEGCSTIKEPELSKFSTIQKYSYFIAIDGDAGICGIRRRVHFAKSSGAKGLIVVTSELNQITEAAQDVKDTFFVFNVLKTEETKKILFPANYILVSLSSPKKVQSKPILDLWISALNSQSYEMLSFWEEALKDTSILSERLVWKPRYALWGCNSGLYEPMCMDSSQYESSCACAGQICSPEVKSKVADAPVKEDARQKIIYSQYPDKFFAYIRAFRANCLKSFQTQFISEDCANSQMISLGIDHLKVHEELEELVSKCSGKVFNDLMFDRNKFSQFGTFPSAILDRQPIRFSTKRELQVDLCKKLGLDKEPGCVRVIRVSTIASFTINVLFFVLIIGGLVGIVGGLLCLYRKTIRKQMAKEMKMQVSASVEHYFALTETK